jgi:N-methylhydantoinase A
MRYVGQSYEIVVPFEGNFIEKFHMLHEKNYGYCNKDKQVEAVNVRVRARGKLSKPEFKKYDTMTPTIPDKAFYGEKKVIFSGKQYNTKIYQRDFLLHFFSLHLLFLQYLL